MGQVIYEVSMSLDGFISGSNVRPEAGLGDGGEQLHEGGMNSPDARTRAIIESWASTGATIVGRTTYNLSIPYWGADGPTGAARVPTIVVSHSMPQNVLSGSVYSFVNGVEAALEKAKALAGDGIVSITGSNVAKQFLQQGLIDEVVIHMIPVVFGSGTPLLGDLDNQHIPLETVEVIETKAVIHLRLRVVK